MPIRPLQAIQQWATNFASRRQKKSSPEHTKRASGAFKRQSQAAPLRQRVSSWANKKGGLAAKLFGGAPASKSAPATQSAPAERPRTISTPADKAHRALRKMQGDLASHVATRFAQHYGDKANTMPRLTTKDGILKLMASPRRFEQLQRSVNKLWRDGGEMSELLRAVNKGANRPKQDSLAMLRSVKNAAQGLHEYKKMTQKDRQIVTAKRAEAKSFAKIAGQHRTKNTPRDQRASRQAQTKAARAEKDAKEAQGRVEYFGGLVRTISTQAKMILTPQKVLAHARKELNKELVNGLRMAQTKNLEPKEKAKLDRLLKQGQMTFDRIDREMNNPALLKRLLAGVGMQDHYEAFQAVVPASRGNSYQLGKLMQLAEKPGSTLAPEMRQQLIQHFGKKHTA